MNYREFIIKQCSEPYGKSNVIYWMERDHRVYDNHALSSAQDYAVSKNMGLEVVVLLSQETLTMEERHVHFAIEGLQEVETDLYRHHIPLKIVTSKEALYEYLEENGAILVTDFNPLKRKTEMIDFLKSQLDMPMIEIDTHNIVPARLIYDRYGKQFAARTIRPKIKNELHQFIQYFPSLQTHHQNRKIISCIDWEKIISDLSYKKEAKRLKIKGGATAGIKQCMHFIANILPYYAEKRNLPEEDYQSGLSPYFHFGHISPQRVAYLVETTTKKDDNQIDFLEEMIIRRELTDNYCLNNENQDSTLGFDHWATETLEAHTSDPRIISYTKEILEKGLTHDDIWNSAQLELVHGGCIHGYLRMYWAKKILEWTIDYKTAFETALYLNDKYAIDGNDPNGIVGVAWSIGGVHDHGWKERPIFGKIRYMNDKGCHRKFNVEKYIHRIQREVIT